MIRSATPSAVITNPSHTGAPVRHEWLITTSGGQFLRGEIVVLKKVLVFRNEVNDRGKELVEISEFRGKVPTSERERAYENSQVRLKKIAQPLFSQAA
jgi:hypothetical protein